MLSYILFLEFMVIWFISLNIETRFWHRAPLRSFRISLKCRSHLKVLTILANKLTNKLIATQRTSSVWGSGAAFTCLAIKSWSSQKSRNDVRWQQFLCAKAFQWYEHWCTDTSICCVCMPFWGQCCGLNKERGPHSILKWPSTYKATYSILQPFFLFLQLHKMHSISIKFFHTACAA